MRLYRLLELKHIQLYQKGKNMRKDNLYKYGVIGIIVGFLLVASGFIHQFFYVENRNKTSITYITDGDDTSIEIDACKVTENTDIWEAMLQIADDPDNPDSYKRYTGATCAIIIRNNQNIKITNWTLRMNIMEDCYLNGFWCGSFEIHQFRDGVEMVETIDSQNYDVSKIKLDKNAYRKDIMIKLQQGDYIVYIPSEAANETVVEPHNRVGAGAIFYYEDELKISDFELNYYEHIKYTQSPFFVVVSALGVIWFVLALAMVVSYFTYRRTKKEVEATTHSIINGLSREYKTLWLINVKNKTIQLIRNYEQKDVTDAMEVAKDFEDYNTAIKYYIDHYVDDADKERVWRDTEFDAIVDHLKQTDFYTVKYIHHIGNQSFYFQMAFTRVESDKDNTNIVLAYRDIDGVVKEEQEKKNQLEVALLQAEAANKSKSQFLANMSHEIRTPINAILGMDAMILRESSEEVIKGYAKDIKTASNTLLALINDILDFSKIESGKMDIIPTKYQLDSVLNDLLNMLKPKANEKGLELELVLNHNTPAKLYGDEIRVKQVMLNILNNAIKYTKEGKITWMVDYEITQPDMCSLKVDVVDTGIGIKPEDIKKIYSPYERVDHVENKSVEGTGLGLSITKNLLEMMGSELVVESTYGEGSKFSFVIEQPMWGHEPIGDNLMVTYDNEEKPEKFHAPTASILVVDDVEMNLTVIKSLLKRVEINPEMCISGEEAIELANEKKYDVILLDAMMPNMSGEETLQCIRDSSKYNRETPIVVLTANAIVGARDEYLAAGFDDYISKPVNGEQLESIIQKYLPEEKQIIVTESTSYKDSKSDVEPVEIHKIKKIQAINVSEGMKATGGKETYINVCSNFYDTASARIQMITGCFENEDYENYTIQTHALKSSARLIGALELSELALEMELAGKESNAEKIKEKTKLLLDMYKSIQSELEFVFGGKTAESEVENSKKELTKKQLSRKLSELKELIEAFDFETAKMLFTSLSGYRLPEDFANSYDKLKVSMAEVDNEEIVNEIVSYMNNGKE